ncbi:MAG TPA: peptidylprolyl isomerase [Abditibacteriaceae bacterium]|jgi:cyclophilin family peptidyl-prolyl cis-trans isomerase
MKTFLLTLPVCAAVFAVGCAAQNTTATPDAPVTPAAATTEPAATTAEASCPTPAAAPKAKTGTYRVVDEVRPGMPPAMVQGLRDAKIAPPPATLEMPANARVQLQTSAGNITVELNTKEAPLHTKSFYYLASKGFFDGTTFHRWANLMEGAPTPGYIIQGGDPLTKNAKTAAFAGGGGPGYQIPRERNNLVHNKLVIAAARTADPNSAGSQFYITQNPVCFLDEGDGYTVFGRIVAGQDAALKLKQDDKIIKAVVVK